MTVKDLLDMTYEEQDVKLMFSNGISGTASDLDAALNDEALADRVEYISAEDDVILIYLKRDL